MRNPFNLGAALVLMALFAAMAVWSPAAAQPTVEYDLNVDQLKDGIEFFVPEDFQTAPAAAG